MDFRAVREDQALDIACRRKRELFHDAADIGLARRRYRDRWSRWLWGLLGERRGRQQDSARGGNDRFFPLCSPFE